MKKPIQIGGLYFPTKNGAEKHFLGGNVFTSVRITRNWPVYAET